jgi:AcrR family transcriptional regulator
LLDGDGVAIEVGQHVGAEATKAVILASARERFAADGYERATIRAIAADAAIDPAMVIRYFGNKEKRSVPRRPADPPAMTTS